MRTELASAWPRGLLLHARPVVTIRQESRVAIQLSSVPLEGTGVHSRRKGQQDRASARQRTRPPSHPTAFILKRWHRRTTLSDSRLPHRRLMLELAANETGTRVGEKPSACVPRVSRREKRQWARRFRAERAGLNKPEKPHRISQMAGRTGLEPATTRSALPCFRALGATLARECWCLSSTWSGGPGGPRLTPRAPISHRRRRVRLGHRQSSPPGQRDTLSLPLGISPSFSVAMPQRRFRRHYPSEATELPVTIVPTLSRALSRLGPASPLVPEPGTGLLVGAGLAGMGIARRRKPRRARG